MVVERGDIDSFRVWLWRNAHALNDNDMIRSKLTMDGGVTLFRMWPYILFAIWGCVCCGGIRAESQKKEKMGEWLWWIFLTWRITRGFYFAMCFTLCSSSRNKNDDDDANISKINLPTMSHWIEIYSPPVYLFFKWKRFETHFSGLYNSKDIRRNK